MADLGPHVDDSAQGRLGELVRLFGKLGLVAFGGPAAHISMMYDEVVNRRRWMRDQAFLDLVGVTNLIPGPNSTEMALHIGHHRAGWRGLITAGAAFILPAALIVGALAWAYLRYGATPGGEATLYGIKPVIIAIIVHALVKLAHSALTGVGPAAVAVSGCVLYLAGFNEVALLAAGAAVVFLLRTRSRRDPSSDGRHAVVMLVTSSVLLQAAQSTAGLGLGRLFAVFLKVGAVLYGSGYVLLAFLHNDLVQGLGVLSDRQLLDAIAIGQLTPGPVFSTATFIGYLLAGLPGALVATVGIFLPSFVFVGGLTRILPRLRRHAWSGDLLDGVNAAALGLMAGVLIQLAADAITDPPAALLAIAAGLALWRTRLNSAWLVLAGALAGLAATVVDSVP